MFCFFLPSFHPIEKHGKNGFLRFPSPTFAPGGRCQTTVLNDRVEKLLLNGKIISRLNRNKNSYPLNESLLDSSMTDLPPSTQKFSSNSEFTRTPNQKSTTDISHFSKVNIENIPGEPIIENSGI